MIRTLLPHNGSWPDIDDLQGCYVTSARLRRGEDSLLLELSRRLDSAPVAILEIPPYWSFTSCMLSISSIEVSSKHRAADDANREPELVEIPDLIGLEGARLSAIEFDSEHFDLVFDSIRLSIVLEAF